MMNCFVGRGVIMNCFVGRGAVVLSFASPRKAQLFLSNAKQAKESALYLCVKDLQKFTFDDRRDKVTNQC